MEADRKRTKSLSDRETQSMLEWLWLTYYNELLFAKGAITEEQRNKMKIRIWGKKLKK